MSMLHVLLIAYSLGSTKAKTFTVLRNTLSPYVYGVKGGATLDLGGQTTSNRSLDELTICLRFNLRILGTGELTRGALFNIGQWQNVATDSDERIVRAEAGHPVSLLEFGSGTTKASYVLQNPRTDSYAVYVPYTWNHQCYAFKKPGQSRLVLNGELVNVNFENDENLRGLTVPISQILKVNLLRCNNDFTLDCTAPGGLVTDFNIWDRAFSLEEQKSWTSCNLTSKGNIVNWETAKWKLDNMVSDPMDMESVCQLPQKDHILFPEARSFDDLRHFCRKLKGDISAMTAETQPKIVESYRKVVPDPSGGKRYFWAGWQDEAEEGVYVSVITGRVIRKGGTYWPFYAGKPNGGRLENCAVVNVNKAKWTDTSCSDLRYGFCTMQMRSRLKLRGLPRESELDREYTIETEKRIGSRFAFDGYTNSRIFHNESRWALQLMTANSIYATTTFPDYPLGTQLWNASSSEVPVTLSLYSCHDETEFNCRNGICLEISQRCNGRDDCGDASDEDDCHKVDVLGSYNREVPPMPLKGKQTAMVELSVNITSILELSEVDSTILVQFGMTLKWRQAELTFRNLKGEMFMNTLTTSDVEKIWYPKLLFFNTRYKKSTEYDQTSVISVERLGQLSISPLTEIQNTHIYSGGENDLNLFHFYTVEFMCDFDMSNYPFDVQQCSMVFTFRGNDGHFVNLIRGDLHYLGKVDLSQYYIHSCSMVDNGSLPLVSAGGKKGVQVDLVLGRRLLSHILTTFLPTSSICMVAFATGYFHPSNFTPIATVNLTSLLVLTTLFIGIFKALPNTAYIKLIDVWLIFCLLMPFCMMLLHTAADYMRSSEEEREGRKRVGGSRIKTTQEEAWRDLTQESTKRSKIRAISWVAKYGLPATFATFIAFFFVYGLYLRGHELRRL